MGVQIQFFVCLLSKPALVHRQEILVFVCFIQLSELLIS